MSTSQESKLPSAHHWSTKKCGRHGCRTAAFSDPDIGERYPGLTIFAANLPADHPSKTLRICHRCGNYSATPPTIHGPVANMKPEKRGPQLRERFWLRFFAVERWVRALLLVGIALLIWEFRTNQLGFQQAWSRNLPYLNSVAAHFHFNMNASTLVGDLKSTLFISPGKLNLVIWLVIAYAVVEVVEGIALWSNMRWGEYLAAGITALFLPYEFYELWHHATLFKVGATALNLALVVYLVYAKRLVGVRGGKAALEAKRLEGSVLDSLRPVTASV